MQMDFKRGIQVRNLKKNKYITKIEERYYKFRYYDTDSFKSLKLGKCFEIEKRYWCDHI